VDETSGSPIAIGNGKYALETMAVDETMIVLEGRLSVSTRDGTVTAGPGDIIYGAGRYDHNRGEGAVTTFRNVSSLS